MSHGIRAALPYSRDLTELLRTTLDELEGDERMHGASERYRAICEQRRQRLTASLAHARSRHAQAGEEEAAS